MVDPNPSLRNLQKIVWKSYKDASMKIFELCTVTYVTFCAPFLAKRALKVPAEEERNYFPKQAAVKCTDMYVDKCLSGVYSPENVQDFQYQ